MSAPPVTTDVVYAILGVDEESAIAKIRNQKPEQIEALQTYYLSIFEPEDVSAEQFSVADRALVAVRVASHTGSVGVSDWYADLALRSGAAESDVSRARDVSTPWSDNTELGAAIRRADRVTLEPASTESVHIEELAAAGLSPAAILSLSQVIAFVSYQLRFIAILRAVGGLA